MHENHFISHLFQREIAPVAFPVTVALCKEMGTRTLFKNSCASHHDRDTKALISEWGLPMSHHMPDHPLIPHLPAFFCSCKQLFLSVVLLLDSKITFARILTNNHKLKF